MPGLMLNEDDSHFYGSRTPDQMTVEGCQELVDHYVSPQMKELIFNPNAMRTSFPSKVWEPIWADYDPNGPEVQEALKNRDLWKNFAKLWPHNARLLAEKGIDAYKIWLDYTRQKGISAWVSMRMNDVHDVSVPESLLLSDFWRSHPEYRRAGYRMESWPDYAFDYGRPEVREHHMKLIREYFERWDFDGFEMDWMRFGFHFKPGFEQEGCAQLTDFTAEVRDLAEKWSAKRGHPIRLAARVPTRPEAALGLGMDAIEWARRGLVDVVVVTPFWTSTDTDIPVEMWRQLLGDKVAIAAALEIGLMPSPESFADGRFLHTAETARGTAASFLHRGADRVYLFNYMDSQTTVDDADDYRQILNHCGCLETATAHPRRHVVSFADTWAPGQPQPQALPARAAKNRTAAFRIHIGPRPTASRAQAWIGLGQGGELDASGLEGRLNTQRLAPTDVKPPKVHPCVKTLAGFEIDPATLHDGYNVVEIRATGEQEYKLVWAEIRIG